MKIFLVSIAVVEALIISAFSFLPKGTLNDKKILYGERIIVSRDDHPAAQSSRSGYKITDTTRTNIRDKVNAYKLPDDVRRNLRIVNPDENSKTPVKNHKYPAGIPIKKDNNPEGAEMAGRNESTEQSVPRLIYEEVPSDGGNKFNGKLQLSLKIDDDGQVVDYRILANSLDCSDCIDAIIKSAFKTRWEPAVVDGKKKEYWVVKAYTFK